MSIKLYQIISKVMNLPTAEINDKSGPDTIKNWTSFKGIVLLAELEKEFNVKFTINEAMDVKTVADVKRHLENHGIKLND